MRAPLFHFKRATHGRKYRAQTANTYRPLLHVCRCKRFRVGKHQALRNYTDQLVVEIPSSAHHCRHNNSCYRGKKRTPKHNPACHAPAKRRALIFVHMQQLKHTGQTNVMQSC